MPNDIDGDAVPHVVGRTSLRAAFSFFCRGRFVGMSRAPPRLWRAWTVLSCTDFVVFIVLTTFHRYYYFFSFDWKVCVRKLKTWGGKRRETNPVQRFYCKLEQLV